MWTYDAFPRAAVKAAHGFEPSQEWLDSLRLSSVRLAGGCSASFVSPDGLVMTNHHCIRSCVQDLSSPSRDYLATGFLAKELKDELRCPKVEANQLVEMTDVTARLQGVTKGLSGAAFNTALKAEMATIESRVRHRARSVRCDVVTLFNGGKYHLYQYRRFQDVRLAFAPEFSMAAFGGDADNFNFPRYGFDAAFLRVWDANGQPLKTAALPALGEAGREGGGPGLRLRPPRRHRAADHRGGAGVPARRGAALHAAVPGGAARHAARVRLGLAGALPHHARQAALGGERAQGAARPAPGAGRARRCSPASARPRRSCGRRWRRTRSSRPPPRAPGTTSRRALDTYRPLLAEYRLKEDGDGFPSELFDHRAAPGARGRGAAQAQRGAAARVHRGRSSPRCARGCCARPPSPRSWRWSRSPSASTSCARRSARMTPSCRRCSAARPRRSWRARWCRARSSST